MGPQKNGDLPLDANTFLVHSGKGAPRKVVLDAEGIGAEVNGRYLRYTLTGSESNTPGFTLVVEGKVYRVVNGPRSEESDQPMQYFVNGTFRESVIDDRRSVLLKRAGSHQSGKRHEHAFRAPMPGMVIKVLVSPGEEVKAGQPIALLEAMKMENELRADKDAVVATVLVKQGTPVEKGDVICELKSL